jgi:hypothetical protein
MAQAPKYLKISTFSLFFKVSWTAISFILIHLPHSPSLSLSLSPLFFHSSPPLANNYLLIDKEALKANGVTDFFAIPAEELKACIDFYKKVVADTNGGDKTIVATCEVSDWLAKAACQQQ